MRISAAWVLGEYRITPSAPHAPPRPNGASARICGELLLSSTVFSLFSAKNPRDVLSGDQKGNIAPSVPGIMRASRESMGRTQIAVFPLASVAVTAMVAPAVESAGAPA